MEKLNNSKAELRTRMIALRRGLDPERAKKSDISAQKRIMTLPAFKNAAIAALYVPVRGEADTTLLLEDCWKRKREVLLPRVSRTEKGIFHFVQCEGPEDLIPSGSFNIPEPKPNLADLQWDDKKLEAGVIVVPGLAFDRKGFRLGYGGGYYDRVLGRGVFARALKIGLAHPVQILDSLPVNEYDQRLDALCSEDEFLWI